jgi:hypothetical protein
VKVGIRNRKFLWPGSQKVIGIPQLFHEQWPERATPSMADQQDRRMNDQCPKTAPRAPGTPQRISVFVNRIRRARNAIQEGFAEGARLQSEIELRRGYELPCD